MKFPNSYFEDEIKSGFYVDARMKCCWAAQIDVLNEIDRVCTKHNIQYFAEWGTLLGTVRHGGYIPWDDDMDISMKREDYNRFLKYAVKDLPREYEVVNYETIDEYYDVMTRVNNTSVVNLTNDFLEKHHNMPYICGVDIFPLDYVTRDKQEEKIQKEVINLVKMTADTMGFSEVPETLSEEWLSKIEKICKQKIDRKRNLKKQLYKIICALYALYDEKESDEIALMARHLDDGGHIYPKSCYADCEYMPFENIKIPVPIGYDHILTLKYGDYMKCVRSGGSHGYPYFEKGEQALKEQGISLPNYQYVNRAEMGKKNLSFKKKLLQRIQLFIQIHQGVENLLGCGERNTASQLLQETQNVAIGIGESIEKKLGEGTETVRCLEQYCEIAYQLYEVVSQNAGVDGGEVHSILDQALAMVQQAAETMQIPKEIVFMPYRVTQWKHMEKVWKAACEEENTIVRVVPLPYYYKKQLGRAFSEMQYDGDQFPEEVPITPYNEYFLENNHPDVIYIQAPYDEWNYSVTIHPNYYAPELWKNTEQLIYIPWFKIDEMNPEDERGLKSRNYFVPMPGVVWADRIILQSEAMKQSYVNYLSDWAGEDTRPQWEEKISGDGTWIYDEDTQTANLDLPDDWKDKKVLLYYISGNGLMEHKEKMLRKMEDSLEIFREQSDKIHILWLQDDLLEERLQSRIPEVLQGYRKILQKYQGEDWLQIEPADREADTVKVADAFYGDGGKSAQHMKEASKPVMLQSVEVLS